MTGINSELVKTYQSAGLGKKAAKVYVAREEQGLSRQEAADELGYDTLSSLDSAHQNAKQTLRDVEQSIREVDPDENKFETLEALRADIGDQDHEPDRVDRFDEVLDAFEQGKAARVHTRGTNSFWVLFQAEDGSIAIGHKVGTRWSAHGYETVWDASRKLRIAMVWADAVEIVDVEDTRLFAAGQFQLTGN